MTGIGNTLYFAGVTGVPSVPSVPMSPLRSTGSELFSISNSANTPTLTELQPETTGSSPNNFTQVGSQLFMTAIVPGSNRTQLIRIDTATLGTDNPTYAVVNSSGSTLAFGTTDKLQYTVTDNGALYFAAISDLEGSEVFKLDNPAAAANNSVLDTGAAVSDIVSGLAGSTPTNLVHIGNTVYFFATNDEDINGTLIGNGRELWSTTGTVTGIVKDISSGTNSGIAPTAEMVVYQNKLYFTADDSTDGTELWTSDGTSNGTTALVINAVAGEGSNPTGLTPVGNTSLFFAATDGFNGEELWSI